MKGNADDTSGTVLAEAAAHLIGCPFRLHGREPATGLDCVGVITAALTATGKRPVAPNGYGLRNLEVGQWLKFAERSGLITSPGPICAGDVLLIALGHCQHHLAIAESGTSIIHAHAGLRQVVRQPLELAWRVCAKWQVNPSMKG